MGGRTGLDGDGRVGLNSSENGTQQQTAPPGRGRAVPSVKQTSSFFSGMQCPLTCTGARTQRPLLEPTPWRALELASVSVVRPNLCARAAA